MYKPKLLASLFERPALAGLEQMCRSGDLREMSVLFSLPDEC